MYVWNELTLPVGKRGGYQVMTGDNVANTAAVTTSANGNGHLYVPLEFWFCRNVGLALIDRAEKHHAIPKYAIGIG
jgi:Major capsid protein N-terminus